jgi:pimeloyl-ACP methyl ester carboxylesterase
VGSHYSEASARRAQGVYACADGPRCGFTPALTCCKSLDTHIDDVTGLLEGEGLQEITLVGHSYAGMVISAVADRESGRLSRLVC